MESFACFLLFLVLRWPCWCLWRSLTRFSGAAIQIDDVTTNRRGGPSMIPGTHQTTRDITPRLVLWSRYIAVGEMGSKAAYSSWKYYISFGQTGKFCRYAGKIAPKLFTSPGTLSSSLRHDSRWDFEEKFRGFCAFLPCLVGV